MRVSGGRARIQAIEPPALHSVATWRRVELRRAYSSAFALPLGLGARVAAWRDRHPAPFPGVRSLLVQGLGVEVEEGARPR